MPAASQDAVEVYALRETARTRLVVWGTVSLWAIVISSFVSQAVDDWVSHWPSLLIWLLSVLLINLFPLEVNSVTLSLDLPVLLAVGFLYSPATAAAVALVGAVDPREFRRRVGVERGIFNRVQVSLSVFAACSVFHAVVAGGAPAYVVVWGTALAIMVDYVVNVALVIAHRAAGNGLRHAPKVANALRVGLFPDFLVTYLGYGLIAATLFHLHPHVGAWSLALLGGPAVIARLALVRAKQFEDMSHQLRRHKTMLSKAFDQIVDERKDERRLVAGRLHDEVLQSLFRVQLGAASLCDLDDSRLRQSLSDIRHGANLAIESLREVILGLRKSPLGEAGLGPALRELISKIQREWKVGIEAVLPPKLPRLSDDVEVAVYQVVREGVVNAAKHSASPIIRVAILQGTNTLTVTVVDDGVGVPPGVLENPSTRNLGLALMRERVELVSGTVKVSRGAEKGTRLEAEFPLRASPHPELI